jgi:hypothetical protein
MAAQVKVMQIIARMNVGGPAVIVAELMRGLDLRFLVAGEGKFFDS